MVAYAPGRPSLNAADGFAGVASTKSYVDKQRTGAPQVLLQAAAAGPQQPVRLVALDSELDAFSDSTWYCRRRYKNDTGACLPPFCFLQQLLSFQPACVIHQLKWISSKGF